MADTEELSRLRSIYFEQADEVALQAKKTVWQSPG